ncbi:Cystatin/monellin superfamily protein [Raphanus sativus]|nr:Cystatin/monellin superfamily protein [Raphanus sativus]
MSSDGVTTKRSSTEEESDSSVSKKLKFEDVNDTNMEDESDTDSGRAWSVDTEDDEIVRPPRINYLNMQDPEPEWDVDSFDGYEFYDPEDRKSFSNDEEYKEFSEFKIQAWKNKGFYEEDPFRSIFRLTDLEQRFRNMTTREYWRILLPWYDCGTWKYRERQSKSRRWVEALHHLYGPRVSGWSLVEYQAKAMDFAGGEEPPFPILCRPAPTIS